MASQTRAHSKTQLALLVLVALASLAAVQAAPPKKAEDKPKKVWRVALEGTSFMPFIGQMQVGQPAQSFRVLFDTGSANLILFSAHCLLNGAAWNRRGLTHAKYSAADSKTIKLHNLQEPKTHALLQFDLAMIHAKPIIDTVRFDDDRDKARPLVVGEQTIALGTDLRLRDGKQFDRFPADGVAGLSFPHTDSEDTAALFPTLMLNELVEEPVFSFYTYAKSGLRADQKITGELMLGGTDKLRYVGPITWAPVVKMPSWRIRIDSMRLLDEGVPREGPQSPSAGPACAHGCGARVNTGVSYIFGPTSEIELLNRELGFSVQQKFSNGAIYGAPNACAQHKARGKSLVLQIGETNLEVKSEMLMFEVTSQDGSVSCLSALRASKSESWILGAPFISNFYTIFDYAQRRIGFAKAVRPRSLRS